MHGWWGVAGEVRGGKTAIKTQFRVAMDQEASFHFIAPTNRCTHALATHAQYVPLP